MPSGQDHCPLELRRDGPMSHVQPPGPVDWKKHGVKVIPGDQLDPNTAHTPGMDWAAAINLARVGVQELWTGNVKIHAAARAAGSPRLSLSCGAILLQRPATLAGSGPPLRDGAHGRSRRHGR